MRSVLDAFVRKSKASGVTIVTVSGMRRERLNHEALGLLSQAKWSGVLGAESEATTHGGDVH